MKIFALMKQPYNVNWLIKCQNGVKMKIYFVWKSLYWNVEIFKLSFVAISWIMNAQMIKHTSVTWCKLINV